MKKIIMIFLMVSIAQVNYAMDSGQQVQIASKVSLKQIPANDLPQYIGKMVIWKTVTGFREAILVKQIPQTSYYEVLFANKYQSVCRDDKLYIPVNI